MHRIVDQDIIQTQGHRVKFVYHDLGFEINNDIAERIGQVDYIIHMAANSHVDRSITHPKEFFHDNVIGTVNLLEHARLFQKNLQAFINFGTDEVFGPAPSNYDYKEDDAHNPSNPYSASKAGQLDAGYAYWITYKLPVITTHTMNIFGERQNPEKLVPKIIKYLNEGKTIPIHCKIAEDGSVSEIGQRHWLHARNAASAIHYLLLNGKVGQRYNVVGDTELDNLQMVNVIENILGKKASIEYVDFHKARPGHDRRYALDGTKLKELGWIPPLTFEDSMKKTIEWTLKNQIWLK
jgi:dTDP-glucose 4,6-dehydratase